jgi:hypothetical protein
MDAFGLFIHVGITICALGFVAVSDGPEEMYPLLAGASLMMLAVRRWLARREPGGAGETTGEVPPAAVRLADLEQRVAELESVQERIFELEERLDFSERLLVKGPGAEPRRFEGLR